MSACLHACSCTTCMQYALRGSQKREFEALVLKFQTVVGHHVGAPNSSLLNEQSVLLIADASLQPLGS